MIRGLRALAGRGKRDAAPARPIALPGTGRISVVIPLYNHARFIADAVESVLAQGPLLRELVVVDDGSTDESAAVMQGLCARDPRIVFWTQPNRGAHAAINAGLGRATGELAAILNSDDTYLPGRLARLAEALDADPGAGIAASALRFIDADSKPVANTWYDDALGFYRSTGTLGAALLNGNFLMTTSNYMFRRTLPDEIGGFAPLRYAHDLDFALRSVARGKRLAWVDEPLVSYRTHGGNTISEDHAKVRVEWAVVAASFLADLWHRPGSQVDWRQAMVIEDVLDRHKLSRAVHLCLTYLRHHPSDTLAHGTILADAEFQDVLGRCL